VLAVVVTLSVLWGLFAVRWEKAACVLHLVVDAILWLDVVAALIMTLRRLLTFVIVVRVGLLRK
jgi:hypothetical protein